MVFTVHNLLSLINYLKMMCVCTCLCVGMHTLRAVPSEARRSQILRGGVKGCPMWVLGTVLRSFTRSVHTINWEAIGEALHLFLIAYIITVHDSGFHYISIHVCIVF